MKKIYKMLADLEQELRADGVHSAADRLQPIIKELKKYVSCEDCTDRTIKPKNCHGTCEPNLYREWKHERRKARIAENRRADNEFVHCRRYSRQRAASAAVEQAGKIKRYIKH